MRLPDRRGRRQQLRFAASLKPACLNSKTPHSYRTRTSQMGQLLPLKCHRVIAGPSSVADPPTCPGVTGDAALTPYVRHQHHDHEEGQQEDGHNSPD